MPRNSAILMVEHGIVEVTKPFHLAAAQTLGSGLCAIVAYDRRMADAARSLDLAVGAPG